MTPDERTEAAETDIVTVVIPTYARVELTDRAIRSVFAQTYPAVELVVVDDASPVPYMVPAGEPRRGMAVRTLRLPTNSGPGAAREAGRRIATGTYIAYLDSDDFWGPRFLEVLVSALRASPDAGADRQDVRRATTWAAVQVAEPRKLVLSGRRVDPPIASLWQRDGGSARADDRDRRLDGLRDGDGNQARSASQGGQARQGRRTRHPDAAAENENSSEAALVGVRRPWRWQGNPTYVLACSWHVRPSCHDRFTTSVCVSWRSEPPQPRHSLQRLAGPCGR